MNHTKPDNSEFYTAGQTGKLSNDTLKRDMQLGKVSFIGTGRHGEYVLIRNDKPVYTATPSEAKTKEGKTWNNLEVYKFRLWNVR